MTEQEAKELQFAASEELAAILKRLRDGTARPTMEQIDSIVREFLSDGSGPGELSHCVRAVREQGFDVWKDDIREWLKTAEGVVLSRDGGALWLKSDFDTALRDCGGRDGVYDEYGF